MKNVHLFKNNSESTEAPRDEQGMEPARHE
jgi:hypothetical protein